MYYNRLCKSLNNHTWFCMIIMNSTTLPLFIFSMLSSSTLFLCYMLERYFYYCHSCVAVVAECFFPLSISGHFLCLVTYYYSYLVNFIFIFVFYMDNWPIKHRKFEHLNAEIYWHLHIKWAVHESDMETGWESLWFRFWKENS